MCDNIFGQIFDELCDEKFKHLNIMYEYICGEMCGEMSDDKCDEMRYKRCQA